jgi:enoyl-CoA hydratase
MTMADPYTTIRIDRRDHVAEVVLNTPDRLNAMSIKFFSEIKQAFEEIDANADVRVAIVHAEGRLFTAGLDLKEAASGVLAGAPGGNGGAGSAASRNYKLYRTIKDLQDCFSAIAACRKPVLVAIHNKCVGGGVDLITACDIRVCSSDATFSIYETKIAIVADVGTLQRITPIVGKGMAREMAMTGRFIDAERALRCGLVNEVYDDRESMLTGVRAMADEIAANSPLAVQGVKAVLSYSEEHSVADGLEYVAQWNSSFVQSNDVTEAVTAFIEKRPPAFSGD